MRRLVPPIVPLVPVLLLAACTDVRQPTAPGDARRDELEAPVVASGQLGDPLPGLSDLQMYMFRRGKYLFQKRFTQSKGLGPTFNASSCAGCHGDDVGVLGGTGDNLETHFTRLNPDSSCSSLAILGGFVKQDSATDRLMNSTTFHDEPLPTGQHDVARRMTPDLFGFGLIEAIPEAAIVARDDPDDADGDGISGRAHMVGGVVGRFGRKAAETSLDRFNAGAYLHEMGITSFLFMKENRVGSDTIGGPSIPGTVDLMPEPELASEVLDSVNAFIRFLAPPPSTVPNTDDEREGEALFTSVGCARCHTPQYTTFSSIDELNGRTVRPFSDFLLHDMGPQLPPHLGDICLVRARRTEFRTEPLMGARYMTAFMHDGLATSIDQAILQHGGEALAVRNAYSSLSGAQRQALIAYINTL